MVVLNDDRVEPLAIRVTVSGPFRIPTDADQLVVDAVLVHPVSALGQIGFVVAK